MLRGVFTARAARALLLLHLCVAAVCADNVVEVRTDTSAIVVDEDTEVERRCSAPAPGTDHRICWLQTVGSEDTKVLCVVGAADGEASATLPARLAARDDGTALRCVLQTLRGGAFVTVASSPRIPVVVKPRHASRPRLQASPRRLAGAPGDAVPVTCTLDGPAPHSSVEFRLTTAEGTTVLSSQTADYPPLNAELVVIPQRAEAATAYVSCVAVRAPSTPAQGPAAEFAVSEPVHFHLVDEAAISTKVDRETDAVSAEMDIERGLADVMLPGCRARPGGNLPPGRRLCLYQQESDRDVKIACSYLYNEVAGGAGGGGRLLTADDEGARLFCALQEFDETVGRFVTLHRTDVETISVRKPHVSSVAKLSISPPGVVYASPGDQVLLTCAGENLLPQPTVQLYFERLDVTPHDPLEYVHHLNLTHSQLDLTVGAADDGLAVACGARLHTRALAGGYSYARSEPVVIRLLEETTQGPPAVRISPGVNDPSDADYRRRVVCTAENPPPGAYLSWFQIYPDDNERRHLRLTEREARRLELRAAPTDADRGSRLLCALLPGGGDLLADPALASAEIEWHV